MHERWCIECGSYQVKRNGHWRDDMVGPWPLYNRTDMAQHGLRTNSLESAVDGRDETGNRRRRAFVGLATEAWSNPGVRNERNQSQACTEVAKGRPPKGVI